jgi:transposase-like protein
MSKRRSFTPEQKMGIVEQFTSGKKTLAQLEKETAISRYQILRWKERYMANMAENPSHPANLLAPQGRINSELRDNELLRLKVKLADLMIENEHLRSLLGGSKRTQDAVYADRRINLNTNE